MSTSTLLGVLFGYTLFLGSIVIATNHYWIFFDVPSLMLVLGGTLATAFMNFQARYVIDGLMAIGGMFKKPIATRENLNNDVLYLIRWAYIIQSKGIIALEKEVQQSKINNPVLKFGADAVAAGYAPEKIREMMEVAVETTFERSCVVVEVLKNMSSTAPAFGMVGTLIGLVIMLQSMGEDMSSLGPAMAMALITTLYGVVLARMVFLPAALKLEQKESIIRHRNLIVAEGLVGLAEKQSPRYLQDRLNSYLDPGVHFSIDKQLR